MENAASGTSALPFRRAGASLFRRAGGALRGRPSSRHASDLEQVRRSATRATAQDAATQGLSHGQRFSATRCGLSAIDPRSRLREDRLTFQPNRSPRNSDSSQRPYRGGRQADCPPGLTPSRSRAAATAPATVARTQVGVATSPRPRGCHEPAGASRSETPGGGRRPRETPPPWGGYIAFPGHWNYPGQARFCRCLRLGSVGIIVAVLLAVSLVPPR